MYTFGGQCCIGGPYSFYNDVHRIKLETLAWERVSCTGEIPSQRSQCLAFLYRESIYVYGGYNGKMTSTDLHCLDLRTNVWSEVKTTGQKPSALREILSKDFRILPCRPAGVVVGNRLMVVSEEYEKACAAVFVLHLRSMRWERCRGTISRSSVLNCHPDLTLPRDIPFDPPAVGNPTVTLSPVGTAVIIGGHEKSMSSGSAPKIWLVPLPRSMDWSRERLLWLACFKNDRDVCHLAKCPPHVMYRIIGYVNSNTFYISRPSQ